MAKAHKYTCCCCYSNFPSSNHQHLTKDYFFQRHRLLRKVSMEALAACLSKKAEWNKSSAALPPPCSSQAIKKICWPKMQFFCIDSKADFLKIMSKTNSKRKCVSSVISVVLLKVTVWCQHVVAKFVSVTQIVASEAGEDRDSFGKSPGNKWCLVFSLLTAMMTPVSIWPLVFLSKDSLYFTLVPWD